MRSCYDTPRYPNQPGHQFFPNGLRCDHGAKKTAPPPLNVYRRKRKRRSGKIRVGYYCDATGKEISPGTDLDLVRLKWAELKAKEKPQGLRLMKSIFDRQQPGCADQADGRAEPPT